LREPEVFVSGAGLRGMLPTSQGKLSSRLLAVIG
jgi:hypothetical protein